MKDKTTIVQIGNNLYVLHKWKTIQNVRELNEVLDDVRFDVRLLSPNELKTKKTPKNH